MRARLGWRRDGTSPPITHNSGGVVLADNAVCCVHCKFYDEQVASNVSERLVGWGDCRRNPPIVTDHERGKWPEVTAIDWCGEFKPKT